MIKTHEQFWSEWAEIYRGFSETVEPYRDAQQELALATIAALGDGAQRRTLKLLDVGGGAGNMISPMLDALVARRGNLEGVTYILTDSTETMAHLTNERLKTLAHSYPDVVFRVLYVNTLDNDFIEKVGPGLADVVINSWNVEYYSPDSRQEIIAQLVRATSPNGVVAFSGMVRMPNGVILRHVLMPMSMAQMLNALQTGGLGKMTKAITGLRQITKFGIAVTATHFPEKPTLAELRELAKEAGLASIWSEYHLYGTSGMVIGSKSMIPFPTLPKPPIAQALVGKTGYDDYAETVTFGSYLQTLRERGA